MTIRFQWRPCLSFALLEQPPQEYAHRVLLKCRFLRRKAASAFAVSRYSYAAIALAAIVSLAGCTLYGPKNPPTLTSTTSAEQYERLYWNAVAKQHWQQASALQAPQVVFSTREGELVDGAGWLALLQSKPVAEYLIGQVQVRPQGQDIALSYVATVRQTASGGAEQRAVLSVWQQTRQGWILISHSETPRTAAADR